MCVRGRKVISRLGAILCIAALGGIAAIWPSYGYNEDGHFYTAVAVGNSATQPYMNVTPDQARLIAFCAQIPDLANDLDAVTLRTKVIFSRAGTAWGVSGACWNDKVRHMVEAQEYVHALTGSDAGNVTKAAIAILRDLRAGKGMSGKSEQARACAEGLAIHLLGDTFAHRRLHLDSSKPVQTYPTGLGHIHDGHDPDYIIFNKADNIDRRPLWKSYVDALAGALGIGIDKSHKAALYKIIDDKYNAGQGNEDNSFNTADIIHDLFATLNENQRKVWAPYKTPVEHLYDYDNTTVASIVMGWIHSHVLNLSFDDVMTKYSLELGLGNNAPKFQDVWELYKSVAVPDFTKQGVTIACH